MSAAVKPETAVALPATLAAVIAEAEAPAHATCAAVMGQIGPILALAAACQKQIAEHRARLFAAQAEDAANDGDLERLHQTLGAWDTDIRALIEAARRVRVSALQYERYAVTEIKPLLIERAEQAAALTAAVIPPDEVPAP